MRFASIVAVAALAAGAGGCSTLKDVASSITSSDSETATVAAPAAPETPPAPATTDARVAVGGSSLSGMSAEALRAAWGEPALKRNDTGAELWQYGSGVTCTLLVYLYPGPSNTMTVSRAEAVPGGADDAAVAACAKSAGKPPLKPVS